VGKRTSQRNDLLTWNTGTKYIGPFSVIATAFETCGSYCPKPHFSCF